MKNNPEKEAECVQYVKMSANKGYVKAMISYGIYCCNGIGVETNFDEALHYFKMAYEKGDREGILKINEMIN